MPESCEHTHRFINEKGMIECFQCGIVTTDGPANNKQEGGDHYMKFGRLQHWDVVAHFQLDYFQGQITKYVMRWKDKNGVQDLKKAQHFLEKYIELAQKGTSKS